MTASPHRSSRRASVLVAAVVAAWAASAAEAKEAPPPRPGDLYVKRDTWADTMADTRARHERRRAEAMGRSAASRFKPFSSGIIRGDGPGRSISVDVSNLARVRLVTEMKQHPGNLTIWGGATLVAKDGSRTPLADLKPLSIRVGWGQLYRRKNWQGNPLRIGKKTFGHGLWVHTDSEVVFELGGRYERLEAWIGMDAARPGGEAVFKVQTGPADLAPLLWQRVSKDFPEQAAWLAEDAGRNREAEWFFYRDDTRWERNLVGRALARLGGAGARFRDQLNRLVQAKTPPGDRRWLTLYARARRGGACVQEMSAVAAVPVRDHLLGRIRELAEAETPAHDKAWRDLLARARRLRQAVAPMEGIDLAALGLSVEALAAAFPDRFDDAAGLLKRIETRAAAWDALCQRLIQGDAKAAADMGAFRDEVRDLWRAVRLGYGGAAALRAEAPDPLMEQEWQRRFDALRRDIALRDHLMKRAGETYRPEALILPSDRDPADVVLRRTAALLADLRSMPAAPDLAAPAKRLARLRAAARTIEPMHGPARFALFADACRLQRDIAFANPLLDFDRILFVKHHRAIYNHMCDQYYGIAARPGGGLYVLEDAFGPQPRVRDVLAGAVVRRGRLKGRKLAAGLHAQPLNLRYDGNGGLHGDTDKATVGSFLSPDLSWDGKTVLFAHVECTGDPTHRFHTDPTRGHWAEGRCWHVFKVNLDGSGLEPLTDGTWNDFDPCWLPGGRVAFVSERRGGYLRCGRVCPTYTLYDMAADGSRMRCLSVHETNEWHPSVTGDGRIIYTRWDYVDRHGCTAHMPWVTTLDGRDSRQVHGNFAPRGTRPDMEVDIRAVPGSHKFVATAAPHHGQAYGTLVLVDPDMEDDDGMAPVRRITPEVTFPESQGGAQVYGTAWPLSADYYLCVYDAGMRPGVARQGRGYAAGNYGIYLVDAFGNKVLVYRDPQIACLSPIPVRPRPRPQVMPDSSARPQMTRSAPNLGADGTPAEADLSATLAVINVYDGHMPWPTGTRITALRLFQVLPMSMPSGGGKHPFETGLRLPSAGDSVVPCRHLLGTVPVEADGSAHFRVPAGRELFFQAVGADGLAVQSMRSATYLHPGERLVCQGCHEHRHRAPAVPDRVPLALRREPSDPKPGPEGSNPFSYPRLVQPVLERHCLTCHAENPKKAPNLAREPIRRNWYASYHSLAPRHGFYNYRGGYRTTPGAFGARASKLYEMLTAGHHDLHLPADDLRRITLWLDCCSMFYGVYEAEPGRAQLQGEVARPTLE